MKNKKPLIEKVAVVIPVYKNILSENEVKSLSQCAQILNKHPIIFVCPDSLDISFYDNFCKSKNLNFKFEKFHDKYFKGIKGYNSLLSGAGFYKRFTEYEYILIYQLDAWVFRDELLYWCAQGYDYIGAPWFEGIHLADENSKLLEFGGNGGLSLRKVNSFIQVLNIFPLKLFFKYVMNWEEIYKKYKKRRLISNILNFPRFLWLRYGYKNLLFYYFKNYEQIHEDIFFTTIIPLVNPNFKIAPSRIAMYFSFETFPGRLYKETNNKLPFGCHGWEKQDPDFWREFII